MFGSAIAAKALPFALLAIGVLAVATWAALGDAAEARSDLRLAREEIANRQKENNANTAGREAASASVAPVERVTREVIREIERVPINENCALDPRYLAAISGSERMWNAHTDAVRGNGPQPARPLPSP